MVVLRLSSFLTKKVRNNMLHKRRISLYFIRYTILSLCRETAARQAQNDFNHSAINWNNSTEISIGIADWNKIKTKRALIYTTSRDACL